MRTGSLVLGAGLIISLSACAPARQDAPTQIAKAEPPPPEAPKQEAPANPADSTLRVSEDYGAISGLNAEEAFGSVDYLRVDKSERKLSLFSRGRLVKTFEGLQFGDVPQGHKRFEGDERTPEGRYYIDARNPNSSYHLSLRISYPNATDYQNAAALGRSPGGDIFLHGQPNYLPIGRMAGDWTDGCIALTNKEIEELWALVRDGAVIDITP